MKSQKEIDLFYFVKYVINKDRNIIRKREGKMNGYSTWFCPKRIDHYKKEREKIGMRENKKKRGENILYLNVFFFQINF